MKLKHITLAMGAIALAGAASATTINGNSLQSGLDALTPDGFYDVSDEANQYNPDEVWNVTASGGSVTRLIFEFAGFENVAEFGIYDVNNVNNTLTLFDGPSCGSADTSCTPSDNYELLVNDASGEFNDGLFQFSGGALGESAVFSSNNFGYYLSSGNGTFYSESGKNGGDDHMVAFQGDGVTQLDIHGGTNYKEFSTGEFILAWEDLHFSGSDFDYSDFVVLVESVTSVFEPGSVALFGLGLAGLAASRRRQKGITA